MLYYTRDGNPTGETIVFIHGFLGDHTIFTKVADDLKEHYDVLLIDLPGHGMSEYDLTNETIDGYVDAIVAVLEHEKVATATWLGHSMGGYIILAAMETNAAQIDKAILAYSGTIADSEEKQHKRDEQRAQIHQTGVKPFVDNSLGAFFSDVAQQEDIEFARQIGYKASKEGLTAALQAMKTRRDQQHFLNTTSIPMLVIEGAADKMVQPINTDNIAVQKTITQTGHLGMLEDPKAFVKVIRQFLG